MDFSKVECFFCVARNASISRAAEELFLSQSNVTMKINSMEKELGYQLFNRTNHGVTLTKAGEYLYKEWSIYFPKVVESMRDAALVCQCPKKELRLGFHGPIHWGGLPDLVRQFHNQYDDVCITLKQDGMGNLKDCLIDNSLDLIITELSEVQANSQISFQYIGKGLSAVAIPDTNPLSLKASISVEELGDEVVIMANNTGAPRSLSSIYNRMEKSGVNMKEARMVDSFDHALAMCAAGLGIVYVPRMFMEKNCSGYNFVDVDSEEMYLEYAFAWNRENTNEYVRKFVSFVNHSDWSIR